MSNLEKDHLTVYKQFQNGHHVIRRSDRYWSGLSTDLIIEQVLMRSIKSHGGLTRGRGMDEIQRLIWLLGMPACAQVNFAMQILTGVCYQTIVRFTQLCSKFPPTALLNFACDWLALDRDISFGRLTSPNVRCYIPIEN